LYIVSQAVVTLKAKLAREYSIYLHCLISVYKLQIGAEHQLKFLQAMLRVKVTLKLSHVYILHLVLTEEFQGILPVCGGI
jgi:hypothetical protein